MMVVADVVKQIAGGYIGAIVMHAIVLGSAYLIIWKWLGPRLQNWRIQQRSRVNAKQIKREVKNAFLVFAVGTSFSAIIYVLADMGYTVLYKDINSHGGWPWVVASFFILIVIDDFWFYWIHRMLHTPRLYKLIHNEHHKSVDVNPFTSVSFHFLEPALLSSWVFPVALLMPTYAPLFAAVQIYGLLDNLKAHLGYEFFPRWFNRGPFRWLTTSSYHNMHHQKYNGNYGVHFRFWDRVMGTEFKTYDAEYEAMQTRKSAHAII